MQVILQRHATTANLQRLFPQNDYRYRILQSITALPTCVTYIAINEFEFVVYCLVARSPLPPDDSQTRHVLTLPNNNKHTWRANDYTHDVTSISSLSIYTPRPLSSPARQHSAGFHSHRPFNLPEHNIPLRHLTFKHTVVRDIPRIIPRAGFMVLTPSIITLNLHHISYHQTSTSSRSIWSSQRVHACR
jgi:hypothetical protein